MELLTKTFTREETVDGLIAHIQEQNRKINGLELAVERSSSTEQAAVLVRVADFLASYFGPVDPDDVDGWSDAEARRLHGLCVLVSASRAKSEA